MSNPEIDKNGTKRWYNDQGELHRLDGPAWEWADGGKFWYKNGRSHREDGPADEYSNGKKRWYIEGKRIK
jgi:hypothetical protein